MAFQRSYYHLYILILILVSVVNCDYVSVVENSTVYLNCGSKNHDKVVISKWFDPTGSDATLHERFSVSANGSLVIKNVRRYDAGHYTCSSQVQTERGLTPIKLMIYLNIKYPPTIDGIKPYIRVLQNKSVVIPCTAKGNPSVTFQWKYPNRTVISNNEKYHLFANGSLLVRHVQLSDVFTYTCAPYNDIGEGEYGHTNLDILIPPRFLDGDESIKQTLSVLEGGVATLSCNATGRPEPNITWTWVNGSISLDRVDVSTLGLFIMRDVRVIDAGLYVCRVSSIAGSITRSFKINVIGRPLVPTQFSVKTSKKEVHVSWKPSYNGGSPQKFELWYRSSNRSDYEWQVLVNNSSNNKFSLAVDMLADPLDTFHYYSLRAKNIIGYSEFAPVIRVMTNVANEGEIPGEGVDQISKNPLEPNDLVVNVSAAGYNLTWQYMITPGRPPSSRFLIEYRAKNFSADWKEFRPLKRLRRAVERASVRPDATGIEILSKDVGDTRLLEFQVSSVTVDNIRSSPSKPTAVFTSGMPSKSDKGTQQPSAATSSEDDDLIPAIVLGSIFGVFVIILVVSLYCFCRRKKRCRGGRKGGKHHELNGGKIATYEFTDAVVKPTDLKFNADSPRRFHVRTCPALQLGKSTTNNNGAVTGDGKQQGDDVFILIEPNPREKLVCTCNKKYFTLGGQQKKSSSKKNKVLYKSSSSPSILLASETDEGAIDTTELLCDEEFDVSELEEDAVAELDSTRIPQLERSAFKDSYDPFCRSESIEASLGKNLRSGAVTLEPKASPDLTAKDPEVSSSGTVESDRSLGTNLSKREPHRDSKSSDEKSSGYSEGIPCPNVSSNNFENFNPITRFVPLTSRSDIGYYSDASSRLSPLEFMNNKYHPSAVPHQQQPPKPNHKYATINGHNAANYFSEDEAIVHTINHRPSMPPSYTQAIVDIERMSEKSEQTDIDSEKSFDHLLEMERQLGVRLISDSDADSDLTTRSLMTSRYRHSIPRNYFSDTGYQSDVPTSTWKDKYSNREKTLRCNQLLEEFKTSRKNIINGNGGEKTSPNSGLGGPVVGNGGEDSRPLSPTSRPYSLVDNVIPEEEVVKRKLSTSSNYNEWLV